jgi:heparan-alpha-glucosaminide N-acetyltransferase
MSSPTPRLASIDVFRALTMFLMIFVNDLWTLKEIPAWLEHTQAREDGMGLADTVFPAFLFIVGLSVPFAIGSRLEKNQSKRKIISHILFRGIALLVMGFMHVNLEHYNSAAALLPKPAWQILLTISFFLVWLDYPRTWSQQKKWLLQGAGIALLVFLAIVYKGGNQEKTEWLKPHWWGILGLIGWAYLLCAIIFVLSGGRLSITIATLLFFLLFNIAAHAGWLSALHPIKKYVWLVGDGAMPALVMAGVMASQLYNRRMIVLAAIATAFLGAGFLLRPYFIISKILATPSWVMICTAISLYVFTALIFIADIKKKHHWFSIIRPAGTSTLTAYLLPYIHYAIYSMIGVSLPLMLRTGVAGIFKSLLYALVIILITGLLEKWKLRLKI